LKSISYVKTREELKTALASEPHRIVITDAKLAKTVMVVSKASRPALVAAIGAVGVSASMAWNPIGWGVAVVGGSVAAPLIVAVSSLIVVIGINQIYALQKGYKVSTGVEVEIPGGFKVKAATVLEPKP
jgi:hypothetical protein